MTACVTSGRFMNVSNSANAFTLMANASTKPDDDREQARAALEVLRSLGAKGVEFLRDVLEHPLDAFVAGGARLR